MPDFIKLLKQEFKAKRGHNMFKMYGRVTTLDQCTQLCFTNKCMMSVYRQSPQAADADTHVKEKYLTQLYFFSKN